MFFLVVNGRVLQTPWCFNSGILVSPVVAYTLCLSTVRVVHTLVSLALYIVLRITMCYCWYVHGRVVKTPLHLNSGILVWTVVACKLRLSTVSLVQYLVQLNSIHWFAASYVLLLDINGRVVDTPLHLNSGIWLHRSSPTD